MLPGALQQLIYVFWECRVPGWQGCEVSFFELSDLGLGFECSTAASVACVATRPLGIWVWGCFRGFWRLWDVHCAHIIIEQDIVLTGFLGQVQG